MTKTVIRKSKVWLDEMSTTEAAEAANSGIVVIFPIGSVEEHGSHLPLCTDSVQAEYVALEVAKKTGSLIAPPLRYGICNAGRNFPGTISIDFESLRRIAKDIMSELARNGLNRIIVMSGHAGSSHMAAIRLAAQDVIHQNLKCNLDDKTRIMVLSDFDFAFEMEQKLGIPKTDGHAGDVETSRMLDIDSSLVKGKGEAGQMQTPRFEIVANPEKYFQKGVNGDPTQASATKGKAINEYVIEQTVKLVEEIKKER